MASISDRGDGDTGVCIGMGFSVWRETKGKLASRKAFSAAVAWSNGMLVDREPTEEERSRQEIEQARQQLEEK